MLGKSLRQTGRQVMVKNLQLVWDFRQLLDLGQKLRACLGRRFCTVNIGKNDRVAVPAPNAFARKPLDRENPEQKETEADYQQEVGRIGNPSHTAENFGLRRA